MTRAWLIAADTRRDIPGGAIFGHGCGRLRIGQRGCALRDQCGDLLLRHRLVPSHISRQFGACLLHGDLALHDEGVGQADVIVGAGGRELERVRRLVGSPQNIETGIGDSRAVVFGATVRKRHRGIDHQARRTLGRGDRGAIDDVRRKDPGQLSA